MWVRRLLQTVLLVWATMSATVKKHILHLVPTLSTLANQVACCGLLDPWVV
jgi:hypothetical protein